MIIIFINQLYTSKSSADICGGLVDSYVGGGATELCGGAEEPPETDGLFLSKGL